MHFIPPAETHLHLLQINTSALTPWHVFFSLSSLKFLQGPRVEIPGRYQIHHEGNSLIVILIFLKCRLTHHIWIELRVGGSSSQSLQTQRKKLEGFSEGNSD